MQKQYLSMVKTDKTSYALMLTFAVAALVSGVLLLWDDIYAPRSDVKSEGPVLAKISYTGDSTLLKRVGNLKWDPAYKDIELYRKDRIYTGAKGKASIFFPESNIDLDLAENSLIEINVGENNVVSALVSGFATFRVKEGSEAKININNKVITIKKQSKESTFSYNAKTGAVSQVEGAIISVKKLKKPKRSLSVLEKEVESLAPRSKNLPSPELAEEPAGAYKLETPTSQLQQYFKHEHLKKALVTFPSGRKVLFKNFKKILNFEPGEIGRFRLKITEQEGEFGISDSLNYQIITVKPEPPGTPLLEYEIINSSNEGRFPLSETNRSLLLKWSESPRATKYDLEIASDPAFSDVIFARSFDKTQREITIPYSESRDIYIRVVAVDAWEQKSDWSKTLHIEMVNGTNDAPEEDLEPEQVAETAPPQIEKPPVDDKKKFADKPSEKINVVKKLSEKPAPPKQEKPRIVKQLKPQVFGKYYTKGYIAFSPSAHQQSFDDSTNQTESDGSILNSYSLNISVSPFNKNYYYNINAKFAQTTIEDNLDYLNFNFGAHLQIKIGQDEFYYGPGVTILAHSNYTVGDDGEKATSAVGTLLPSGKIERSWELENFTKIEIYGVISLLNSYIFEVGTYYYPDINIFDFEVLFGLSHVTGNIVTDSIEKSYSQTSFHTGLMLPF